MGFRIGVGYRPRGDQENAIAELTRGVRDGEQHQVLLGVTGSGKTFTIAKVIENIGRPALVLAHNKTLAAQLYHEFKAFFPENAVEYFVITTITSPKPTFRRATFTSKRRRRSTTSSISCASRPPSRFSSAAIA